MLARAESTLPPDDVPCLPADADGFPRPKIRYKSLINPNRRMRAGCTTFDDPPEVATVWKEVVRQVVESELGLAIRLAFT